MKLIKNIQAWLVCLTFTITVGLLFGGQALFASVKVNNPVKRELSAMKEVKDYSVKPVQEGLKVELKLAQTGNLQAVLDQVKQSIELYHHKPVLEMTITDRPNQRLTHLQYQLSFYIEEARATGEYVKLKAALDGLTDDKTIAKVYLSDSYLYLQLEDGSHYIYQAIPRNATQVGINQNAGGDSIS